MQIEVDYLKIYKLYCTNTHSLGEARKMKNNIIREKCNIPRSSLSLNKSRVGYKYGSESFLAPGNTYSLKGVNKAGNKYGSENFVSSRTA